MAGPEEWFKSLTPVAKVWLSIAVITTFGAQFGFINLAYLYFDPLLIYSKFQVIPSLFLSLSVVAWPTSLHFVWCDWFSDLAADHDLFLFRQIGISVVDSNVYFDEIHSNARSRFDYIFCSFLWWKNDYLFYQNSWWKSIAFQCLLWG